MKVIHIIEGDRTKIKLDPCKSKQPNLETVLVIKGVEYPEVQVGKYVHSFQEGETTQEGKQYACIQFSITPDIAWEDMWTTLQGRWMIIGKTHMKP